MILHQNVDLVMLFILKVVHYVESEGAYCPRSLYDCNSLESGLYSSADVIITPEFMTSSHEDNYIGEICQFFKRPECSDPVLSQCKGEVIYATKAFKIRQQYICGERFTRKGLQSMKTCVHKFSRHFSTCHQKRHTMLEEAAYVTETTSASNPWCKSLSLHTGNTISAPVSSYRSHKENLSIMHELRNTGEDLIPHQGLHHVCLQRHGIGLHLGSSGGIHGNSQSISASVGGHLWSPVRIWSSAGHSENFSSTCRNYFQQPCPTRGCLWARQTPCIGIP